VIRASMIGLLALSLVALGSLTAQQPGDKDEPPPVLLKKKKTDDKKPDEKKADDKKSNEKKIDDKKPATKPGEKVGEKGEPKDEPEGPDPEAKAKELLAKIAKDIDSAKERLKDKDTGDGTQQVQRDIVKGLDDLIEAMKNPPPQQQQNQQSNPGAGEQSKDKNGQQSRSQSRQQQRSARNQRGQQSGNPMAKNGPDDQQQQKSQSKAPAGQTSNGATGGNSPPGLDKLADLYKDTWGEYPFRERQEMDAYQKEGYMAKYRELLKQYYSTIAEKGRRPTEGDR
jgi:hypothetical protein